MSKILDWIKSHKALTVLIAAAVFLLPLVCVHVAYKINAASPFFVSTWDSGNLITYIAGFEAFIGTVFLGSVAVYQNRKANDLNARMLENEERRDAFERQPCVFIDSWNTSNFLHDRMQDIHNKFSPEEIDLDGLVGESCFYEITLNLVNVSKTSIALGFQSFRILCLTSPSLNRTFIGDYQSDTPSFYYLSPQQSTKIYFIFDSQTIIDFYHYLGELKLVMFNTIGEKCIENIKIPMKKTSGQSLWLDIGKYSVASN